MTRRGPDDCGLAVRAGLRAGTPPALDHRPVAGRTSAHGQRRRLGRHRLQRRNLQLRRPAPRAWKRRDTASAPAPTRKCSSTATSSGASRGCCGGSAACTPSPSSTSAGGDDPPGPRSVGQEAALLPLGRGRTGVRLLGAGPGRGAGRRAAIDPAVGRRPAVEPLYPRPADHFRRRRRSSRPVMPGAWAATARRSEYRHWRPDFFHPEEGVGRRRLARARRRRPDHGGAAAFRRRRAGRRDAFRRRRLQPGDGDCGQDDGDGEDFLRGQ